jgi:transposase
MMEYFIGIDVSKSSLDMAVVKDGALVAEAKIENTAVAVRSFIRKLVGDTGVALDRVIVCMEHTGIYNAIALEVFFKKGVKICVEPALRIKYSQGMTRGKTDKIDARRIAVYAFKNQRELAFWKPQRLVIQKMQALLSLRQRLLRAKTQLNVPIREAVGFVDQSIIKELRQESKAALNGIMKNLKSIDDQINRIIAEDVNVRTQIEQITSVPGLGKITAANMVVTTNEFTRINEAKKFACYSGVAPFEHSSGSSIRGKTKVSKLANMDVKTLLHLAAMSAIRSNKELKVFYERKVAEGKNKMSVINAVRNKLISRAFACVTQGRLYQKNYQNALA